MACDWLMQLHSVLRERLPSNERPGICSLLHSAVKTKQQLEKGVSMYKALQRAAKSVYGSRMTSLTTREVSQFSSSFNVATIIINLLQGAPTFSHKYFEPVKKT